MTKSKRKAQRISNHSAFHTRAGSRLPGDRREDCWWLQSSSTLTSVSWRQMGKVRSCGLCSPSTRWRGEPGSRKGRGASGTGKGKEMLIPNAVTQIGLSDAFAFDQAGGKRCPSLALKRQFASKYNLATPQAINSQGEAITSTLVMAQEHFMLSSLSWYKSSI